MRQILETRIPYRLSYLDKPEDHNFVNFMQAAISVILETRAQSTDFQEYSTWMRKTGHRC